MLMLFAARTLAAGTRSGVGFSVLGLALGLAAAWRAMARGVLRSEIGAGDGSK